MLLACVVGCAKAKSEENQQEQFASVADVLAQNEFLNKSREQKDKEIADLEKQVDLLKHEYRNIETALMRKSQQYHEALVQMRKPYLEGMAMIHRNETLRDNSPSTIRTVDYNEQIQRDIRLIDAAIDVAENDVKTIEQSVSENVQKYGF